MKHVDPPLLEKEMPRDFIVVKKFMLVNEYFTHDKYSLPMMLKKLAGESEIVHQERVKKFLLACDDQKFSDISNLINPENQF